MAKIGFTGTMSCGKTTLVKALKQLPEFKDYEFSTERSKYLRDLGIPLNTDSTLKGQTIFLAERCSELIKPNIITDRTIIDVMAFTTLAKSINSIEKDRFIEYAFPFINEYDYIFYISPEGVPIENNNVRTIDPVYRQEVDEIIKVYINKFGYKIKNINTLSGSVEERVDKIKQIVFS
jgi:GTPase SAR1 family protein